MKWRESVVGADSVYSVCSSNKAVTRETMGCGGLHNNHLDTQGHSSEKSAFEADGGSVWPISTCGGVLPGPQQGGPPCTA